MLDTVRKDAFFRKGFPGGAMVKNPPANEGDVRDLGAISESGRSPGAGHGNPLQQSYLENPMDRRAWRTVVHCIAKSQTQLSMYAHIHWKTVFNLKRSCQIFFQSGSYHFAFLPTMKEISYCSNPHKQQLFSFFNFNHSNKCA